MSNPQNEDTSYDIRYRSVMEESTDQYGAQVAPDHYDLHNGELTVYHGDKFIVMDDDAGWAPYTLTVVDVLEKRSLDKRGQEVMSSSIVVKCESDSPQMNDRKRMIDSEIAVSEANFVERVRKGEYKKHGGNKWRHMDRRP